MAKNDDMILRGKALKDLRGIKDVLMAQGDPFLANIMNRAIECIENQPAVKQEVPAEFRKCCTCAHYEECTDPPRICGLCHKNCTCSHCVDYSGWEPMDEEEQHG